MIDYIIKAYLDKDIVSSGGMVCVTARFIKKLDNLYIKNLNPIVEMKKSSMFVNEYKDLFTYPPPEDELKCYALEEVEGEGYFAWIQIPENADGVYDLEVKASSDENKRFPLAISIVQKDYMGRLLKLVGGKDMYYRCIMSSHLRVL